MRNAYGATVLIYLLTNAHSPLFQKESLNAHFLLLVQKKMGEKKKTPKSKTHAKCEGPLIFLEKGVFHSASVDAITGELLIPLHNAYDFVGLGG